MQKNTKHIAEQTQELSLHNVTSTADDNSQNKHGGGDNDNIIINPERSNENNDNNNNNKNNLSSIPMYPSNDSNIANNESKGNVVDNETANGQAPKSMTPDKAKLIKWANDNGIPSDWVFDFDSFENIAKIYPNNDAGKIEFYKDYNIQSGKQKNLAQRMFNTLEKYRTQSNGV